MFRRNEYYGGRNVRDIVIPSTAKQIQTQKILHEYRERMLGSNLKATVSTIDPDVLQAEVSRFVGKDCRMILQGLSIREEVMFALPCVLKSNPILLGYYRLLMGISEKQFYTSATGLSVFKTMEHDGKVNASAEKELDNLCCAINNTMALLLRGVNRSNLEQDLTELPLMTLGVYADGVWRNIIGTQAALHVFETIKQIVKSFRVDLVTDEEKCLRFKNNAGNIYRVVPSSDPDISVFSEGQPEEKILCIEIKGGQDVANVHNRAGEAEKAHLKAGQAGWREKWTVIYLVGLQHKQADKLLTESPSTDKWFDINEVCAQSGKTYDSFKNMLVSRFGLIVNSICDV